MQLLWNKLMKFFHPFPLIAPRSNSRMIFYHLSNSTESALIFSCFKDYDLREIFGRLNEYTQSADKEKEMWAMRTLEKLSKSSPTSLLLTAELFKLNSKESSLKQCLIREYALANHFLTRVSDFYEGVRFKLIEKNRTGIPNWQPSTIDQLLQNYTFCDIFNGNYNDANFTKNLAKSPLQFLSESSGSAKRDYCLPDKGILVKDLDLLKRSMSISEAKKTILHKYKYKTGLYEVLSDLINEKNYL